MVTRESKQIRQGAGKNPKIPNQAKMSIRQVRQAETVSGR